ncbi:hypothetical protein [Kordia jejudonensis]|uniref:hypothetical protein n=1 Tax=Kordia jejudonensis TaxID=1348245 RepID=UPI0007EC5B94|nr:hypothetical protein [Kordia jejudonensis]
MEHKKIEEAYNDTFSGLTMYYRDCTLNPEYIAKYTQFQIIQERGFTDVSSFAKGLCSNLRYAIASNKAKNMTQVNPNVKKYGFHVIAAPSYYKVLDIYKIGDQTQILLLHFDEKYKAVFQTSTSNIEEKVIGMGRASFDKKIQLEFSEALQEDEWRKRTQFPIGMSDNGEFFLNSTSVDKPQTTSTTAQTNTTTKTLTPEQKATTETPEKKSFWKKLFG